jgi:PleD family two-component response regulator
VAERIREALAKMVLSPDDEHENKVAVTASIGMAATTETPMLTDLVTRAEAALFRAKYTGGNRIEEGHSDIKPTLYRFEHDE